MGNPAVDNLAEPLKSEALGLVAASNGRVTISSGWRSTAEQQRLYDQNCCGGKCTCHPATAKPGTSQHELGRAVDFGGDLNLAAELAPRFNLVRTVPGEAWHYEDAANRDAQGGAILAGGDGLASSALGVITSPISAAQSIADSLGKLGDSHLWLRVAEVVGGVTLCIVGAALLGVDLSSAQLHLEHQPGADHIRDAGGAGRAPFGDVNDPARHITEAVPIA